MNFYSTWFQNNVNEILKCHNPEIFEILKWILSGNIQTQKKPIGDLNNLTSSVLELDSIC